MNLCRLLQRLEMRVGRGGDDGTIQLVDHPHVMPMFAEPKDDEEEKQSQNLLKSCRHENKKGKYAVSSGPTRSADLKYSCSCNRSVHGAPKSTTRRSGDDIAQTCVFHGCNVGKTKNLPKEKSVEPKRKNQKTTNPTQRTTSKNIVVNTN